MAERREIIELTESASPDELTSSLFVARILDEERREVHSDEWPTPARSLDGIGGERIIRVTAEGRDAAVVELDGVLAQLTLCGGRVFASVADSARERLRPALDALKERLPVADPSAAHEVTVTFWTYGPHGPQPAWRSIAVPEWHEISENYTAETRAKLDGLMHRFEPSRGGQLILWHGRVGTGKTFALRALAWEWRDWCAVHYIVDPDSFFGEHADYLMSVLLQPGYEEMEEHFDQLAVMHGGPAIFKASDGERRQKPWRLLILEDTGELLTPDAKAVIGQGLSRFLNVVDGLIGQGLRVLVLVTTNEPIRKLHPAVARPGRCAANIEFLALEPEEATEWLHDHGSGETVDAPQSLASLYALLEGRDPADIVEAGFAA